MLGFFGTLCIKSSLKSSKGKIIKVYFRPITIQKYQIFLEYVKTKLLKKAKMAANMATYHLCKIQ